MNYPLYDAETLQLPTLPPRNFQAGANTHGALLSNASPWWIRVTTPREELKIPPMAVATLPVQPNDPIAIAGILVQGDFTNTLTPYVSWDEQTQSLDLNLIALAEVPAFQQTVYIANANIPVTGSIDANITNASIPVSGSVNANVTNASIPVSGSIDANITNADITVTPASSVTFPISGSVDANITNADITVTPASSVTFPVSGSVNANITNASIPVSGSINANITNATIDTNSTILNEQVQVGLDYVNSITLSVPSQSGTPVVTSSQLQVVPVGNSITSQLLFVGLTSQNGQYYTTIQVTFYYNFSNGDSYIVYEFNYTMSMSAIANSKTAGTAYIDVSSIAGSPIGYNALTVGVVSQGPNTASDVVYIDIALGGQVNPGRGTTSSRPLYVASSPYVYTLTNFVGNDNTVAVYTFEQSSGTVVTVVSTSAEIAYPIKGIHLIVTNTSSSHLIVTLSFGYGTSYGNGATRHISTNGTSTVFYTVNYPTGWWPVPSGNPWNLQITGNQSTWTVAGEIVY